MQCWASVLCKNIYPQWYAPVVVLWIWNLHWNSTSCVHDNDSTSYRWIFFVSKCFIDLLSGFIDWYNRYSCCPLNGSYSGTVQEMSLSVGGCSGSGSSLIVANAGSGKVTALSGGQAGVSLAAGKSGETTAPVGPTLLALRQHRGTVCQLGCKCAKHTKIGLAHMTRKNEHITDESQCKNHNGEDLHGLYGCWFVVFAHKTLVDSITCRTPDWGALFMHQTGEACKWETGK